VANDRAEAVEEGHRSKDLGADRRVLLDHLELLVGERARLVDQRVRDGDLADVMEDPAVAQVLDGGPGPGKRNYGSGAYFRLWAGEQG
jgi:hypothetical protein